VTAREGRPIIICEEGDEETGKYRQTFLGHPGPLVRGMDPDPDPDPSISKQK